MSLVIVRDHRHNNNNIINNNTSMSVIKYYLRYWHVSKGNVMPWRPAISQAAAGKIFIRISMTKHGIDLHIDIWSVCLCVVVNKYDVTTNPSKIALIFVHLNNHLTLETVKSWKRQSIYLWPLCNQWKGEVHCCNDCIIVSLHLIVHSYFMWG